MFPGNKLKQIEDVAHDPVHSLIVLRRNPEATQRTLHTLIVSPELPSYAVDLQQQWACHLVLRQNILTFAVMAVLMRMEITTP